MKVDEVREKFLDYLERQQGKDYVEEEEYYFMSFENLILLEAEHYKDFCVEFVEIKLAEG